MGLHSSTTEGCPGASTCLNLALSQSCLCNHPTYRITHTMAFVTPVVEHWMEREIAQWVHSMNDRSDDPSHHERTLLPRSYISLPLWIGSIVAPTLCFPDLAPPHPPNCPELAQCDCHLFPSLKGHLRGKHFEDDKRARNVLFNDALNTFYLQLYGIRHMVKDHSDSEIGNLLPPHRLLLSISSKGSFIYTIPDRITHTMAFVTPVVEHWHE